MPSVNIVVPTVGESITEVVIGHLFKKSGDLVKKDEAIVELETDKINHEIPSPDGGVITLTVKEGDKLNVGAIIGTIEVGAGAAEATPAPAKESAPAPAAAKADAPKASSVAKKVAADIGVNLGQVEGHGVGGRITKADVLAASAPAPVAAPEPSPAAKAVVVLKTGERSETRERMSTLRKRIAQRLVEAQHTAAILTTFNEIDMSTAMEVRTKYKEAFAKKHGVNLGFMSFFVKAAVEALKANPRVNAYIENDEIVYHNYMDIGVAVGTEKGLVVPVLRNAENLSFAGVELAIKAYAEKAKAGKLTIEDLTGGTFTISNGGVYGSLLSTPIINPPQSGILGMHNIVKRPIAVNDQVVIRPMMYVALSYDHRIVDGKEAVGFLIRIKECLESPERMLLDL